MKDPGHAYLADLVELAKSGDGAAFTELYEFTYNKVYNYCRHYMRDSFLAQDAMQEVYTLVYKKLNTLKDPLLFTAWLNQISFHVCFDMSKKRNADYGLVDDEILATFSDDSTSSNPEEFAQKQDAHRRLEEAIAALPPLQYKIIVMRYFNDMKINDIANALDISVSSVKRYKETAEQTLKASLS